jgi:hypothetical protein
MRRTRYATIAGTLALVMGGGAVAQGTPVQRAFAGAGELHPTALQLPARATHAFTEHAVLGILNKGNTVTLLGGVATGTLGSGAVVLHNKPITANTGKGRFTMFVKQGWLSGTYTISARVGGPAGPKGFTIVQGKGAIIAGSGAFRGATGSFTYAGKSASGVAFFVITFRGSYTS